MSEQDRVALVADLEQVVRYTTTGAGVLPAAPFNRFGRGTRLAGPEDTFVSINSGPGRFLITPPGWIGEPPAGATRIASPTRVCSIVGRLAVEARPTWRRSTPSSSSSP